MSREASRWLYRTMLRDQRFASTGSRCQSVVADASGGSGAGGAVHPPAKRGISRPMAARRMGLLLLRKHNLHVVEPDRVVRALGPEADAEKDLAHLGRRGVVHEDGAELAVEEHLVLILRPAQLEV